MSWLAFLKSLAPDRDAAESLDITALTQDERVRSGVRKSGVLAAPVPPIVAERLATSHLGEPQSTVLAMQSTCRTERAAFHSVDRRGNRRLRISWMRRRR
jgi:hypothetical protein